MRCCHRWLWSGAIVLSALLAKYGLKAVVLERWPERCQLPRAVPFDWEVMRPAFHTLSIAEQAEIVSHAVVSLKIVSPDGEFLSLSRHSFRRFRLAT